MKVKALVSFSGQFSMGKGEIAECSNKDILHDLLNAKYVEVVSDSDKEIEIKETEKPTEEVAKPTKKRVKKS